MEKKAGQTNELPSVPSVTHLRKLKQTFLKKQTTVSNGHPEISEHQQIPFEIKYRNAFELAKTAILIDSANKMEIAAQNGTEQAILYKFHWTRDSVVDSNGIQIIFDRVNISNMIKKNKFNIFQILDEFFNNGIEDKSKYIYRTGLFRTTEISELSQQQIEYCNIYVSWAEKNEKNEKKIFVRTTEKKKDNSTNSYNTDNRKLNSKSQLLKESL